MLELAQGSRAETLLYSHRVFGLGAVLGPVLGTRADVFSGDRNPSDVQFRVQDLAMPDAQVLHRKVPEVHMLVGGGISSR